MPVNFSTALAIDPRDAQHVWLAGDTGLLESTNAGRDWAPALSCPDALVTPCFTDVKVDPGDPDVIYAADDMGIWRRDLDAQQRPVWSRLDTSAAGLSPRAAMYRISLGIASPPSHRVYAAFGAQNTGCLADILVSDDPKDNSSWHRVVAKIDSVTTGALPDYFWPTWAYGYDGVEKGCQGDAQAYYDNALAVNPADPNDVYAGGVHLIHSTDSGATWTDVSNALKIHADIHSLIFDDQTLYVASDGGAVRISPSGVIEDLNAGLAIMQFDKGASYFGNPHALLVGSQDNGTSLFPGADLTPPQLGAWRQVLGGDGGVTRVDPVDPSLLFAEHYQGDMEFSTDGGGHWTSVPTSWKHPAWVMPFKIGAVSRTIYAGAENVYKISANDARQSDAIWHLTNSRSGYDTVLDYNVSALDVVSRAPADGSADIIVAGWNSGLLRASYDGGSTWSDLTSATNGWGVADVVISPTNPKELFVALNRLTMGDYITRGSSIYQFSDASHDAKQGDAIEVTGDLRATVNVLMLLNGVLYAGADDGVYALTRSPSLHWSRLGDALPNVMITDLLPADGGIIAITHGRGIWRVPISRSLQ